MTHIRRWFFLPVVLCGTQLLVGCYLGYTNRPVLFPNVALAPAYARPGAGYSCGTSCYREFGPSGCGGSLLFGPPAGFGPVVSGPVYDAPIAVTPGYPLLPAYGHDVPLSGGYLPPGVTTPGCTNCGQGGGQPPAGIPIAGLPGGPPIATSGSTYPPPAGPVHGVPYDSGMIVPTVKPPSGSVPLQMPSEVKESKKIVAAGK
jgi:hypothetical protein